MQVKIRFYVSINLHLSLLDIFIEFDFKIYIFDVRQSAYL